MDHRLDEVKTDFVENLFLLRIRVNDKQFEL